MPKKKEPGVFREEYIFIECVIGPDSPRTMYYLPEMFIVLENIILYVQWEKDNGPYPPWNKQADFLKEESPKRKIPK